jgi:hypothetical protein
MITVFEKDAWDCETDAVPKFICGELELEFPEVTDETLKACPSMTAVRVEQLLVQKIIWSIWLLNIKI